jgi:hypothetical protein
MMRAPFSLKADCCGIWVEMEERTVQCDRRESKRHACNHFARSKGRFVGQESCGLTLVFVYQLCRLSGMFICKILDNTLKMSFNLSGSNRLLLLFTRYSRVVQRSKALHPSAKGVTTDPGSIVGCITTGRDQESYRAAHNWPSVARVGEGLAGVGRHCKIRICS